MSIGSRRIFGSVPDVEGRLVAPGFQHHHGCREIVLLQFHQQIFHVFLCVPAVCGNPEPHSPFRGKNCRARQTHVFPDHGFGGAGKHDHIGFFRKRNFNAVLPECKCCNFTGIHIQAESGIRPEEGGGAVGFRSLEAELLLHLIDNSLSFLVQAVKLFTHAVSTVVVQLDDQFIARAA